MEKLELRIERLEAENAILKKSRGPERLAKLSNREKAEIVYSLSGNMILILLKIIGLPRSSYYYARKHPKAATRPDVHEKVKEIFNRTSNGCGHRQIFMRLRREFNIVIAKKTVLKVMRELGLICKIRRQGFQKAQLL